MAYELVYTSVPQGLELGSRGFCTVAATDGLPTAVREWLERLSGYRHLYPPGDPRNPATFSHCIVRVAGESRHIISRVADAGLDYSERGNKLAHHVVVEAVDMSPAGPAWLMAQPSFFLHDWTGQPRKLPPRQTPWENTQPAACRTWERVAGDAGWAGLLAESVFKRDDAPVFVVFRTDVDLLSLFAEAIALLPPEDRWRATFSTFYMQLPPGIDCRWRGVLAGSAEATATRGQLVIDLSRALGRAPDGVWTEAARTGQPPAVPAAPISGAMPPAAMPPAMPRSIFDKVISSRPQANQISGLTIDEDARPSRLGWRTWTAAAIIVLLFGGSIAGFVTYSRWQADRHARQKELTATLAQCEQKLNALQGLQKSIQRLRDQAAQGIKEADEELAGLKRPDDKIHEEANQQLTSLQETLRQTESNVKALPTLASEWMPNAERKKHEQEVDALQKSIDAATPLVKALEKQQAQVLDFNRRLGKAKSAVIDPVHAFFSPSTATVMQKDLDTLRGLAEQLAKQIPTVDSAADSELFSAFSKLRGDAKKCVNEAENAAIQFEGLQKRWRDQGDPLPAPLDFDEIAFDEEKQRHDKLTEQLVNCRKRLVEIGNLSEPVPRKSGESAFLVRADQYHLQLPTSPEPEGPTTVKSTTIVFRELLKLKLSPREPLNLALASDSVKNAAASDGFLGQRASLVPNGGDNPNAWRFVDAAEKSSSIASLRLVFRDKDDARLEFAWTERAALNKGLVEVLLRDILVAVVGKEQRLFSLQPVERLDSVKLAYFEKGETPKKGQKTEPARRLLPVFVNPSGQKLRIEIPPQARLPSHRPPEDIDNGMEFRIRFKDDERLALHVKLQSADEGTRAAVFLRFRPHKGVAEEDWDGQKLNAQLKALEGAERRVSANSKQLEDVTRKIETKKDEAGKNL